MFGKKIYVQPFSSCKAPVHSNRLERCWRGYWGQGGNTELTPVFADFTWNGGHASSFISARGFGT